jgi:hypothetical protein
MNRETLLENFVVQVTRYEKHELLVARAKEHSENFTPVVVERVISDHVQQAMAAVSAASTLFVTMEQQVVGLSEERTGIETSQVNPRVALEELELRLLIGEIDEVSYENESTPLLTFLSDADVQVGEIEQALVQLRGPMDHWTEVKEKSSLRATL